MGKRQLTLTVKNSVFYDNDADYTGAAINIWSNGGSSTLTMDNSTLYDNTSFTDDGGWIAQFFTIGNVTSYVNNCIIYGADIGNANSFDVDGQNDSGHYTTTITMRNSLIGDYSTTEYTYNVSNVTEGSDPLFTSTASDDYTLQDNSPAVDTGSSTYAPSDDLNLSLIHI